MRCKILKTLPFIATLAILTGCTAAKAPKLPTHIEKGDYTYLKEYMRWYIQKEMEDRDIVGLSIALVDDQKIVWQEGFGYGDKKQKIKATPKTKYRAGSITKVFNALAVMKLQEMGKMDIDKPLVTYLPNFSIKSRFGDTDGITPRTIMTHHSGLPGDWIDGMFAKKPLHYTKLVNKIQNEYVAYPPNTILSYSNLAVTLLGDAIEKVSGEPYAKFLQKSLLEPLRMNDSDFEMALGGVNASKSYSKGKETFEYPIGQVPAGALNTTVSDLSQLIMMINSEGNEKILKRETLMEMFRVQNENIALDIGIKMGLGWFINTQTLGDIEPVYGHDGGTIAHRSSFGVAPKSKLGVVVLVNSDSGDVAKIANTLLQKAWEAKTGKKLSFTKNKLENSSDFTGTWATMFGKADIVKKADGHFIAKTANGSFNLKKEEDNRYYLKYRLFGLIPIGDEASKNMGLYTHNIDNNHLVIAHINGQNMIVGAKAPPTVIFKAWEKHLGTYKIINQQEPKMFQIQKLELKIEDDYLVKVITMNSGEKMVQILQTINDTEAIKRGEGRGSRESVRLEKDGILTYAGLRFEPISNP